MLTVASCSSDDDVAFVPEETPEVAFADYEPVSWLAKAYTPEDIKAVEDDISAIRGAGYTYIDNESYCVGTHM